MALKDYEFWLIVGSQHLYGEETAPSGKGTRADHDGGNEPVGQASLLAGIEAGSKDSG